MTGQGGRVGGGQSIQGARRPEDRRDRVVAEERREEAADRWRRGAIVFGVAVIIGAAARWFVPENRVGLLAVRGRVFDTAAMGVMGVLIATLALTIDPLGTD